MIPTVFVFMKTLPLTPSGKTNRRALPAPQEADWHHEAFVAPETAVEKTLCELWQDVLLLERVGIKDNFFALGGHSLLATRLISAIRERFDIELPLRALFDFPTVAELATSVEAKLLDKRTEEEEEREEFFL
jgi:acyl carrier protein